MWCLEWYSYTSLNPVRCLDFRDSRWARHSSRDYQSYYCDVIWQFWVYNPCFSAFHTLLNFSNSNVLQYRFIALEFEYEGYEFRVPHYSLDKNCKSFTETCVSARTVPVLSSAHTKKFLLASVCNYIDTYMETDKLDSCKNHRAIEWCTFNGILFYCRTLSQKNLLKIV